MPRLLQVSMQVSIHPIATAHAHTVTLSHTNVSRVHPGVAGRNRSRVRYRVRYKFDIQYFLHTAAFWQLDDSARGIRAQDFGFGFGFGFYSAEICQVPQRRITRCVANVLLMCS